MTSRLDFFDGWAIWIPWSEVEAYEVDGWHQVAVQEDPTVHDHYSALMVREEGDG